MAIDNVVKKYHIPLREAKGIEAFVIPGRWTVTLKNFFGVNTYSSDPLGILKPDEVVFRSSVPLTDPDTGRTVYNLIGTVLVWVL
jgi:hypothetical protein